MLVNCVHRHSVVKKLHTSPSENIVKNSQNFEVSLNCFLVFTFIPPLHYTDLYLCLLFSRSPQNISLSPQICLRLWLSVTRAAITPSVTDLSWHQRQGRDIVTDHYSGPSPKLRSLNSQHRLRFSDIFTFCIELNKMCARVNGSLRPLRETESCHGPQQYILAAMRI